MADQVKAKEREGWRLGDLTGAQLALIGAAIIAAIVVTGVILSSGDEATPSLEDLGAEVTTQQAQYETLLDARPRVDRLVAAGASPALVTDAFDSPDAAEGAVEESTGGADGYREFLSERLDDEREHLRLAGQGMASPAAVQNVQANIEQLNAEIARVDAG